MNFRFTYIIWFFSIVLLAVASIWWLRYNELLNSVASSEPIRWYRCQDSDRPLLQVEESDWTVTYSWAHGMGEGDVTLDIKRSGDAVLKAYPHGSQAIERIVKLTPTQIQEIAETIDTTGLLCQSPQLHADYRVNDIGRFKISVRSQTGSKDVFVDECHSLEDGQAFEEVVHKIYALKSIIGTEIEWGPEGSSVTQRPCTSSH